MFVLVQQFNCPHPYQTRTLNLHQTCHCHPSCPCYWLWVAGVPRTTRQRISLVAGPYGELCTCSMPIIRLSVNWFAVSQSVSKSVSQSVSLSVSPSVHHSVSPSVCQSVHQSVRPSVSQLVFQSISQSVSQSVGQVLRLVNQPVTQYETNLIQLVFLVCQSSAYQLTDLQSVSP